MNNYIKKGSTIGIIAPSFGLFDDKHLNKYLKAKEFFLNEGYKIVEAKFHEEKADFYNRKAEYLGDLKKRIFEFQREGKSNKEDRADALKEMAGIRVKRVFNLAKLLSYVVVPVLAIGGGYQLGVHLSNQIDEYKTTTRVVDPVTHEVVETLKEEYDERDTPYTSTLKLYEAWKKNPKGNGYVRKVTAYVTDPSADPLDTTGLTEKYHYTESKETLSEKDNTDESVTLLTETVQDKNDSRKSRKYVVWLIIAGVVLAGAIDGLLAYNINHPLRYDDNLYYLLAFSVLGSALVGKSHLLHVIL